MMKSNMKEKKAAKLAAQKQADIKLYRLMVEFGLAIAALFLTITAGSNEIFTLVNVIPIVLAVSGVLFGISAVYFCVMRSKHIDESYKIITSAGIFGNFAALFLLSSAFYLFMSAELVISALIALTVTYFAYNAEGAGFFGYSAVTASCFIALNLAQQESYYVLGKGIALIGNVLSFAIPVAAVVLACVLLRKKEGVAVIGIKMSGKKIALAMMLSAVVTIVGAALVLVYPTAASIAVYTLISCYFIITVIGIFKMM